MMKVSIFNMATLILMLFISKTDCSCQDTTEYKKMISSLDRKIKYDSRQIGSYRLRAFAKYKIGDYLGAKADCDSALKLDIMDTISRNYRGLCNISLNLYNEAIIDFTYIINHFPNHIQSHFNRAYAYKRCGKNYEALDDLNFVIESDSKNCSALENRGVILYDLRLFNKALLDFNSAIELCPNDVKAYCNRSKINLILKKYKNAINDAYSALKLDSSYVISDSCLAVSLFMVGKNDLACKHARKFIYSGGTISNELSDACK